MPTDTTENKQRRSQRLKNIAKLVGKRNKPKNKMEKNKQILFNKRSSSKLRKLVVNERLSREKEFKKYPDGGKMHKLLWKRILKAIKAKAKRCTRDMTVLKIQAIFRAEQKKTEDIRRNEEIKQLLLNARLPLETEFKKYSNVKETERFLWLRIVNEVKAKASCSTENLTIGMARCLFRRMLDVYSKKKNNGTQADWRYFEQMDQVYGNENIVPKRQTPLQEMHVKNKQEMQKLRQLVLNERLSLEPEFKKCTSYTGKVRNELWQRVLHEVKAKATFCTADLTSKDVLKIFRNLMSHYVKLKKRATGKNWHFFKQIHNVYGNAKIQARSTEANEELKNLLLNARLSLETEFRMCQKYSTLRERHKKSMLLWQHVLNEVKAKSSSSIGAEQLTVSQIKTIFIRMQKQFLTKQMDGTITYWPYAERMQQLYSVHAMSNRNQLTQLILNARLSLEPEFKKNSSNICKHLLWQQIQDEVKAKATCCTADLTMFKIRYNFYGTLATYKQKKKLASGRKWQYFEQIDKVYGHSIQSDATETTDANMNECTDNSESIYSSRSTLPAAKVTVTKSDIMAFLAHEAACDEILLQQIVDIEKEKLKLQKEEIVELKKWSILLNKWKDTAASRASLATLKFYIP